MCIYREQSGWGLVTIQVPQVSAPGSLLFIKFLNDLDLGISNYLGKFADDTEIG